MKRFIAVLTVSAGSVAALAGIDGFHLGTDAPPADVVGRAMTPMLLDDRHLQLVSSFADPLGGDIDFSTPMEVRRIGMSWATWSHGYTGTVYNTFGRTEITTAFEAGTKAIYFYAEPGAFSDRPFTCTATASTGETIALSDTIHGMAGAKGFAFYSTGGSDIASVRVVSLTDFSIGEFAVSRIPAPGAASLLALAGLTARRRRR